MEIKSTDFDTETGFLFITTIDELSIQCCLNQRKDKTGYKKEVCRNDSGFDTGICGDINEQAFKKYGKSECLKTLLQQAKKSGIVIK